MERNSMSNIFGIYVLVFFTLLGITITLVYHSNREWKLEQQVSNLIVNDTVYMTQAHVSIADSIAFEYAASQALHIDMPEEYPITGDTMCAYVSGDTIYVEYYHGHPDQIGKFVYLHNY